MPEMQQVRQVVEGALLVAGKPLSLDQLLHLFGEGDERPARDELRAVLEDIETDCNGRGYELKRVASGYRFQAREELAPWLGRLWEEKPARYSRALLETLAIIAYRQPITRGDIEEIRGVAVSSNIMRTLLEREWIRVVGHRDVPGKPALYATTRLFLDYFNLQKLGDLPPLNEIRDLTEINPELEFEGVDLPPEKPAQAQTDEFDGAPDTGESDSVEIVETESGEVENAGIESAGIESAGSDPDADDEMPVESDGDSAEPSRH